MEFYEVPRFCGNVDFCSETHPRIINIPLGISTFPVSGPGELDFHHQSRNSMISGFSAEIATFAEISRSLVKIQLPGPRRENINIP